MAQGPTARAISGAIFGSGLQPSHSHEENLPHRFPLPWALPRADMGTGRWPSPSYAVIRCDIPSAKGAFLNQRGPTALDWIQDPGKCSRPFHGPWPKGQRPAPFRERFLDRAFSPRICLRRICHLDSHYPGRCPGLVWRRAVGPLHPQRQFPAIFQVPKARFYPSEGQRPSIGSRIPGNAHPFHCSRANGPCHFGCDFWIGPLALAFA